jgi:hypothetical protein
MKRLIIGVGFVLLFAPDAIAREQSMLVRRHPQRSAAESKDDRTNLGRSGNLPATQFIGARRPAQKLVRIDNYDFV